MSDQNSQRVYLTVEEVADLLRVCRTTVYSLIARSRACPSPAGFPVTKIGGTYRVRRTDLDAWLDAGGPMPDETLPEAS